MSLSDGTAFAGLYEEQAICTVYVCATTGGVGCRDEYTFVYTFPAPARPAGLIINTVRGGARLGREGGGRIKSNRARAIKRNA